MMGAFICKRCGTYNVSGGGCGACGFEGIDSVFTVNTTDTIEKITLQEQIEQLREDVNTIKKRLLERELETK